MNFDFTKEPDLALREFEHTFRHEFTHLVIASVDAGRTPRWLNEGLATYEEKGRDGRAYGEGRKFYERKKKEGAEPDPVKFFFRNITEQYTQYGSEFYEHSYIIAKCLVDNYGWLKLQTLFREMKNGKGFSVAFQEIYSISLVQLAQSAYQN